MTDETAVTNWQDEKTMKLFTNKHFEERAERYMKTVNFVALRLCEVYGISDVVGVVSVVSTAILDSQSDTEEVNNGWRR